MKKRLVFVVLLSVLLLSISPVYGVGYRDLERTVVGEAEEAEWGKYVTVTINSSDIDEALSNFPVLIYLSNSSSGENDEDVSFIFDEIGGNSKKISVQTSDETECYVEVEKWDADNEQAWLWVKVPSVSNTTDTTLNFYYDNSHADNDAYVGDPNSTPAEKVWDDNYVLVTHMRDDPDTSHIRDSTENDHDGTKAGANQPQESDGKISKAQQADGTADYITVTDHADIKFGDDEDYTIELWLKTPATLQSGWRCFFEKGATGIKIDYGLWMESAAPRRLSFITANGVYTDLFSASGVSTNTWYYILLQWNQTKKFMYINDLAAVESTPPANGKPAESADNLTMMRGRGVGTYDAECIIDEFRISDVFRSASWKKACYETQRDHLLTYGSEETASQYPANIVITNLEPNYAVKLYNSIDGLVTNATANTQWIANMTLPDSYRTSAFQGTFKVYDNNGFLVYSKTFNDIHGGDEYKALTRRVDEGASVAPGVTEPLTFNLFIEIEQAPSRNITVTVYDTNGTIVAEAWTTNGTIQFEGLEAGTYYVTAESNGQIIYSNTFELADHQILTLKFDPSSVWIGLIKQNLQWIIPLAILIPTGVWLWKSKGEKLPKYIPKLPESWSTKSFRKVDGR